MILTGVFVFDVEPMGKDRRKCSNKNKEEEANGHRHTQGNIEMELCYIVKVSISETGVQDRISRRLKTRIVDPHLKRNWRIVKIVCVHPQQYQNDHILLVSLKATAVHNRFQTLAPLPNKMFRYETE